MKEQKKKLFWIKTEKMEELFDIVTIITKSLITESEDPETVIKILMQKSAEILNISRSCLFLVDEDDEEKLVLKYGCPEEEHGIGTVVKLSESPPLQKVSQGNSIHLEKNPLQTNCISQICKTKNINKVLYVPLRSEDELIGVLVLDAAGEKKKFFKEEISLIERMSHFVVEIIQIAKKKESEYIQISQAAMAHAIKNPSASAGGLIRRTHDESKKKNPNIKKIEDYSYRAVVEIKRIESLMASFGSFKTAKELELEELDLNQLVSEVAKEKYEEFLTNKIPIEISFIRGVIPVALKLDGKKIKEVIRQLINNVQEEIDYDKNEKITIKTERGSHKIHLKITNTGSIIPPDQEKLIFTPLYAGRKKFERGKSWGFGLAIVQAIVKAHKGTISVKSKKKPSETTFTIKFPIT